MYPVSCSKQSSRVRSGSVTVDSESNDDMRSYRIIKLCERMCTSLCEMLTVGFVNDDNLVG